MPQADRDEFRMMHHTVLWRRLDLPGHEIAYLRRHEQGWALSGTAIFTHEQQPCKLDYVIYCDESWHTIAANVTGQVSNREVDLSVAANEKNQWRVNGSECKAVSGCIDVDLGFSASTNLLPIRRLALEVGDEAEVRAAWLPFPSLSLQPLEQLYRREARTKYRYESRGGRFVRSLDVDSEGFITNYPGLWVAESVA